MPSFPSQQSFSATNQSDEDVCGRLSTWHWVAFFTSVSSVASPTLPVVLFPWCLCLLVLFVSLYFWAALTSLSRSSRLHPHRRSRLYPPCSVQNDLCWDNDAKCRFNDVETTMTSRTSLTRGGEVGVFVCAHRRSAVRYASPLWCELLVSTRTAAFDRQ